MPFPFLALIPVVGKLLEKILPDADQANAAKAKLLEMAATKELKELDADVSLALAQLEVNKEEAKAGPFRGGWRPFIGWACGVAFAYNYVILPFGKFVIVVWGSKEVADAVSALPALDFAVMMPVVMGMLGLSWNRTQEKQQGMP